MSLQAKAMLVRLSLSKWGMNRQDADSAGQLASLKHANQKALRVTKRLLADNPAFGAIRTFDGALGVWHRQNTVPFDDDDARLLPTLQFDSYTTHMRRAATSREELVRVAMIDYDAFVAGDRIAGTGLGDLWNSTDYPDRWTVRERFKMKLTIDPVPDRKHFLVTIAREDLLELQRGVDGKIAAAEQAVKLDLFRRLSEPILAMAEKLADTSRDLTLRTTNPLVENLRTVLELIPRLNITGDAQIDAFRTRAMELAAIRPESLKTNEIIRGTTARKAQAILDDMADFMGGAPNETTEPLAA